MKYPTLRTCACAFLFLYAILNNANAQVQTPRYASIATNSKGYYEYLPQGYSSESQSYPMIIFLHGIGEQGAGTSSSLPAVLRNGVPRIINEGSFPTSFTVNGQTHKFIVISPQFSSWPRPADLNEVINYMVSHYRVNTTRIYMTGLSMGGGATWEYAGNNSTYASRLAAIVPVCGASWPDMTRSRTMGNADLAVWATHNQVDESVPPSYTIDYVNNINSVNPTPLARRTIFNASGHDAWTTTYNPSFRENNMNIYQWMLQYQRGSTTPPANRAPVANAGVDKVIKLPVNSVSLSGSASDPDGTISRYSWSKVSGPSQFTISNAAIANPSISNLVTGTYVFRLTVTDNANATGYDELTVRVDPADVQTPPVNQKLIPGKIEAEKFDAMSGIQTENTKDAGGGLNISYVHYRDWLDYNVTVTSSGNYTLNLRIACYVNTGQLQLMKSGTVLTTVNVPNTGGYQSWRTISTTVYLQAGNHTLRIYSSKSGAWFLNWMEFVSAPSTASGSIVQQSGITTVEAGSTGLSSQLQDAGFRKPVAMFPNPVTNIFALQLDNEYMGMTKIQIVDLSGRVRREMKLVKTQSYVQYQVGTEGLTPGTYFIRVETGRLKNTLKMIKL